MDEKTLEWLTKHRDRKSLKTSVHLLIPLLLLSVLTGAVLEVSNFFGISLLFVQYYHISCVVDSLAIARVVEVKRFEVFSFVLLNAVLVPLTVISSIHFPLATKSICLSATSFALPVAILICRTSTKPNRQLVLLPVYACVVPSVIAASLTADFAFVVTFPTALITALGVSVICGTISLFRLHLHIPAQRKLFFLLSLLTGSASIYYYYAFPTLLHAATMLTVASTVMFFYLDFVEYQMRVSVSEYTNEHGCRALSHTFVKITAVWAVACWGGVIPLLAWDEEQVRASRAGSSKEPPIFIMLAPLGYFIQLIGCHVLHEALKSGLRKSEPPQQKKDEERGRIRAVIAAITVDILMMITIAGYYSVAPHPLAVPEPFLLMAVAVLFILLTNFLDSIGTLMTSYNKKARDACVALIVYEFAYILFSTFTLDHSKRNNSTITNSTNSDVTRLTGDGEAWDSQFYLLHVSLITIIYCIPLIANFMHAIDEQEKATKAARRRSEEGTADYSDDDMNTEDDDDDVGTFTCDTQRLI